MSLQLPEGWESLPKKTRRCKLPLNALLHFDFLEGLVEAGTISEQLAMQLAQQSLEEISKEEQRVLEPLTGDVLRMVVEQLRSGRRKISIWKDERGQRYVAAELAA